MEARHRADVSDMTAPTIPTEDDFVAMQDEALANNRANGLPAKAPTEITRRTGAYKCVNGHDRCSQMYAGPDCPHCEREVAIYTSTTPDGAKAWVDDMAQLIRQMCFAAEIDGWEHDNDRRLGILNKYFPEQYERICEELWTARENVKQLRW